MSRTSRTAGSVTLAAFASSDAMNATNAAICHARFGGRSTGYALTYAKTERRENVAHGRYGWHDAHATASVRRGCTANSAVAAAAPASRGQLDARRVGGRALSIKTRQTKYRRTVLAACSTRLTR